MVRECVAAVLAGLWAGAAWAQDSEADWLKKPTPAHLFAVWPAEAMKKGVNGKATISCRISVQGALHGCKVLSEEAAGLGFGAAGLELSKSFRIRPWTAEGLPTIGAEIRVPIRYVLPDEPPPPAAARQP